MTFVNINIYLDILYLILGGISIITALFDFLFYRIPNVFVFIIIVLFIILGCLGLVDPNGWSRLETSLVTATLTFGVGMLFYICKLMGAGDVKFIAAASLWASYAGMFFGFLFVASLIGGIIAGTCYFSPGYIDGIRIKMIEIFKRILRGNAFFMGYANQPFIFMESENRRKIRIPYGIAITSGIVFVIYSVLIGQGIK